MLHFPEDSPKHTFISSLKKFFWCQVSWLLTFIRFICRRLYLGLLELEMFPEFVPETVDRNLPVEEDTLAIMVTSMTHEEMRKVLSPMLDVIEGDELEDIIKYMYNFFSQRRIMSNEFFGNYAAGVKTRPALVATKDVMRKMESNFSAEVFQKGDFSNVTSFAKSHNTDNVVKCACNIKCSPRVIRPLADGITQTSASDPLPEAEKVMSNVTAPQLNSLTAQQLTGTGKSSPENVTSVPEAHVAGALFKEAEDVALRCFRKVSKDVSKHDVPGNLETHQRCSFSLVKNGACCAKPLENVAEIFKREYEELKLAQKKRLRMVHTCPAILHKHSQDHHGHSPPRTSHPDPGTKIPSPELTTVGTGEDSSNLQNATLGKYLNTQSQDNDGSKNDCEMLDSNSRKCSCSKIPVPLRMAGDCSAVEGNAHSVEHCKEFCSPRRKRSYRRGEGRHRNVTPHPEKKFQIGHSRSRSGPATRTSYPQPVQPDAGTKLVVDSINFLAKADGVEFANVRLSMEFEKQFKAFAKFGIKMSTGIVITEFNSERWFRQANIIDSIVSPGECSFFFHQVAGTGIVLTIQNYMTFLCHLAKYKGISVETFIHKLADCGLPDTKKVTQPYQYGPSFSDERS